MTHVRTLLEHSSKIFVALLAAALVFSWMGTDADAHHQPANKFVAAGAALDDLDESEEKVVLQEFMKVPTTHDLALSATVECSILTYLKNTGSSTPGATETSKAEGRVEMWLTIDGKVVPVQTGDLDPSTPEVDQDNGRVTFCNRAHEKYIEDSEENEGGEDGGDGIDEQREFLRTRNANAFNWFALNVGSDYDNPANGNNVLDIQLHAKYTRTGDCQADLTIATQEDCSDAFVGKRTLIAEPTNASVHETVTPVDTDSPPKEEEPNSLPVPLP